jgi:hypothetical protein
LSQIKRAAERVWGKLLIIQWRHRFLSQLERIEEQLLIIQWRRGFLSQRGRVEGLRGELLRIQWKREALIWLGMAAERFRGKLLVI